MTDYEKHKLFYEQFNTVVHNHTEWLHSPQGTLEVLADPWKAQPPQVRVEPNINDPDHTQARDILRQIRARQQRYWKRQYQHRRWEYFQYSSSQR
jgi:hypothetical protein